MDFVVARFNDMYGYISTGKDKSYGFDFGFRDTLDHLRKKCKNFTYARPEELAVSEHQREWTQKDLIYYNKLKHLYEKYLYEQTKVLIFTHRGIDR